MMCTNGELFYTNKNSPYTDGDMLTDSQEIEMIVESIEVPDYIKRLCPMYTTNDRLHRYIFKKHSDPNKIDTDGDKYTDDKDPNPCFNDIKIYSLKDPNYIHINNPDPNFPDEEYGGNQSWFANDKYGKYIEPSGCGLIALVDSLIYLGRNNPKLKGKYIGDDYQKPVIDLDDYKKLVTTYYEQYYTFKNWKIPYVSPITVKDKKISPFPSYHKEMKTADILANPNEMAKSLRTFSASTNTSISGYYITNMSDMSKFNPATSLLYANAILQNIMRSSTYGDANENQQLQMAISSIEKDIPVIICSGIYSNKGCSMCEGIGTTKSPYELDFVDSREFNVHYMTITSIIVDPYLGKTIIKVSNWGKEYYLYYEDFVKCSRDNKYGTVMCGMFCLKINS